MPVRAAALYLMVTWCWLHRAATDVLLDCSGAMLERPCLCPNWWGRAPAVHCSWGSLSRGALPRGLCRMALRPKSARDIVGHDCGRCRERRKPAPMNDPAAQIRTQRKWTVEVGLVIGKHSSGRDARSRSCTVGENHACRCTKSVNDQPFSGAFADRISSVPVVYDATSVVSRNSTGVATGAESAA